MARILLAEDDRSMCDFLKVALTKAGHDVVAAHDGLEALNVLKDDQAFDLLLTDIVMPGMDGIELSQEASDISPNLKVMFITGFAAVAMSERLPEQQNTKLLSKPFHLKDLVDQIDKLLAA